MNEIEQKQIEEMAREIQKSVNGCAKYWATLIAKHLIEQDYRNVKDKVVLGKEEYQNDFSSQFNKGYEKGSKETAREIFDTIIKALEEKKERVKAFYGVAESVGADVAIRTIKKLAEEHGVGWNNG